MKKYLLGATLLVIIGLGFWRGNKWINDWMTQQSLSQIQKIQKYVLLDWKSMKVNSLAFKVHFTNVRLQPQWENFQQEINPQKLTVQIAPWASLIQRTLLINISIEDFQYQIPLSKNSHQNFELLQHLPINKIYLKSAHLKLMTPQGVILASQTEIQLKRHKKGLYAKIKSKPILKKSVFFLQSRLYAKKDQIEIISLNIHNNISKLLLSGNIKIRNKIQEFFFDFQSNFNAKDLNTWIEHWRTPFPVQGSFNIQSQLKYSSQEGLTGPFEFFAKNFLWLPLDLSQIKIKGLFEKNIIKLEMAHLEKEKAFTSYFENMQIHINKNKQFQFKNYSSIEDFGVVERLLHWNSGIHFQGQIESNCKGVWSTPELKCRINFNTQDLYMTLADSKPPIFSIEKGQITSDVIWTPKHTNLKGQISVSSADSLFFKGTIENDQAKISFNGPVDLNHVQNIYGFDIKGFAPQWKGTMTLGKNGIVIDSSANLKNLYISKYLFGNVKTSLKLDHQGLYLNKIKAHLGESRYKGSLNILFKEEKIQSQAQFSPLFLEDLSRSIKDVIPAPLNFIGKGKAQLSLDSPLKNLNYQIHSQFQNVKMYDEFFKKLNIHVSSKNGKVQINKAEAEKLKGSVLQAVGVLKRSNELDLKITGSHLPVEKSENLKKWINSGILNFQLDVTGSLQNPKGSLSGLILADSEKQSAKFKLHLTPDQISGQGDFFNESLWIQNFKFFPKKNNISFSATAKNWDFIPLIRGKSSLISSQLTGTAVLHFSKNFKKLSGFADIKTVQIQHGLNQSIHSEPFYMEFNKGKFSFRGSDLKWKTNEKEMTLTKIDAHHSRLSGIMGLEIFSLIFPQIKNIRGDLQADLKIKNNFNRLSPEGNIWVEDGMIDVNNHINPLQSIALTGQLKSQIMRISQFTALTPLGGNITAEGLIDFSKSDLLPIEISAQMSGKTAVYISDKIHGVGYGSIKIYGDKAPYTLAGIFNVQAGSFKQELDSTEDSALPESSPDSVHPFYWDLKVQFDSPFPVENTLFSSLLTGSLHLKGNFLNPQAEGRITFVPGGNFYIRDYDFEINSGSLNYNSQSIYEPQLQIIGATQFEEIRYDNERETTYQYDITADITGTPGNVQFAFSSQPALSESDILSMLAIGARSIEYSPTGFSPQVMKHSYAQIAAVLFQDIFGRELSKSLGLRFSFTPYMNLSKNKSSNKIGIHKRWFEKMNTSYIGSVERDYDSFKVEYMMSPVFSLLGVWEKKETLNQDQSNTLGLEMEYKLDF